MKRKKDKKMFDVSQLESDIDNNSTKEDGDRAFREDLKRQRKIAIMWEYIDKVTAKYGNKKNKKNGTEESNENL
jgi:hypothetical protein